MGSDLDIQRAIEAGQRNLEAVELIRNWCRHARVEKFGGLGLIEQQTGLPIGHHSMVCDHAPAGGFATYLLEESALEFHDRNCASCTKRDPVRLPNISKLLAQRDTERQRVRARQAEDDRQRQVKLDARRAVRAKLRSTASVLVSSFLDDLDAFDASRSETAATRLVQSARLAPELLTPEVTEHLFALLESEDRGFAEVVLRMLPAAAVDRARLARCAMQCVAAGEALQLSCGVAADFVEHVDAADVGKATLGFSYVACPPRSFPHSEDESRDDPEPLRRLFTRFPAEVTRAIDALISDRRPFFVRMGTRAACVLGSDHPTLLSTLRRSFLSRLAGADLLVDAERDSELRDVVHDLTLAAVAAFLCDPAGTDGDLMRYFEGASGEGEARLSGVYEHLMRRAARGGDHAAVTASGHADAYRAALNRLMSFATTSENDQVVQDVIEALRSEPGQLVWLVREQMDMLLGAAVLADSKLASGTASTVITSESPFAGIEAANRRSRLHTVSRSFIRWAAHAAADDTAALRKFTSFLDRAAVPSDTFQAGVIEELPPLMGTASELQEVLPFLYRAMVGESTLVRAAAATCVGEVGSRRLAEMPDLVAEAFLLMLSDPYVIVHKAAVRALGRVQLPEKFRRRARAAVGHLILVYRTDKDSDFLLTCMDVYLSGNEDEALGTSSLKVLMAILSQVPKDRLLRNDHQWLLRRFSGEEGYAALVLALLAEADSEYEQERILDLVREIPQGTSGQHRQAAMQALTHWAGDPLVAGTLVETFTRDGDWGAAVEVSSAQLAAIPGTTRMRSRKLIAERHRCHAEFEYLISQGRVDEALAAGAAWHRASAEIEKIRKEHEKTDPFRSVLGASQGGSGAVGGSEGRPGPT